MPNDSSLQPTSARDLLAPQRVQQVFEVLRRILRDPQTITVSTTLVASNTTVEADATAGAITVTLPRAADHANRVYVIKKVDASANAVTVDANAAELIDGALTKTLTARYDDIVIQSDGTGWLMLTSYSASAVTGSGTLNRVAKWTPTGAQLGDSSITDDGVLITTTETVGIDGTLGAANFVPAYPSAPLNGKYILRVLGNVTVSGGDGLAVHTALLGAGNPAGILDAPVFNLSANAQNIYGLILGARIVAGGFTGTFLRSAWIQGPLDVTGAALGAGAFAGTVYGLEIVDQVAGTVANYAIYTGLGRARFGDNISVRAIDYIWPAAGAVGVLTNDGLNNLTWAAGGSGAPVGASYLTLGLDGTLTSERVLTAGTNISFVDTGANGTLTINAASGSGNSGSATLAFGATGSTSAVVTVTGQAWVTGTSKIVAMVLDDARAEDAVIESLNLSIANRVVGTGFDIYGAPQIGDAVGDFSVAFVGV